MQNDYLETGTVRVKLTSPEQNISDLGSVMASMMFVAKMTEQEALSACEMFIKDGYTQAMLELSKN